MAVLFPNEQPLSTHDTIDFTEAGIFTGFEEELQSTAIGQNQTKRDYEFCSAGHNGQFILAKPIGSGNLWATEITQVYPNQNVWVENAQYDPSTGGIRNSSSSNIGFNANGACNRCGISGLSGNFCNLCGYPLTQTSGSLVAVPGSAPAPGAVPGLPGASPASPAPAPGAPPATGTGVYNPNRMEGKPKKEIVIPKGMSVTESTVFSDELDKLLSGV